MDGVCSESTVIRADDKLLLSVSVSRGNTQTSSIYPSIPNVVKRTAALLFKASIR